MKTPRKNISGSDNLLVILKLVSNYAICILTTKTHTHVQIWEYERGDIGDSNISLLNKMPNKLWENQTPIYSILEAKFIYWACSDKVCAEGMNNIFEPHSWQWASHKDQHSPWGMVIFRSHYKLSLNMLQLLKLETALSM